MKAGKIYYKVPKGSRTESVIADIEARKAGANRDAGIMAWKHKADGPIWSGGIGPSRLIGFIFGKKKPPEDWVRPEPELIPNCWRPNMRKPLSAAAEAFKKMPEIPGGGCLLRRCGVEPFQEIGEGRILTPGYFRYKFLWYMTAQPGCPLPDDVVPLTIGQSARIDREISGGCAE